MSSTCIALTAAALHPNISAQSITALSLTDYCSLESPLDPASLPFVRSLAVSLDYHVPFTTISPLLPQLTSLTLSNGNPASIAQCVSLSTSLKILSLRLHAIGKLNLDTQAIIRDKIEELRIIIDGISCSDPQNALSAIVNGSRVIKKVIVDGSKSSSYGATMTRTMKTLVPVCKKAKVELWKENFKAGNGKVDVDSE